MSKQLLTYDIIISFLMKHKPSELKPNIAEGMKLAIDDNKNLFIEKNLKNVKPHFLLCAYDDLVED